MRVSQAVTDQRGSAGWVVREPRTKRGMRPLTVVVRNPFGQSPAEMPLVDGNALEIFVRRVAATHHVVVVTCEKSVAGVNSTPCESQHR